MLLYVLMVIFADMKVFREEERRENRFYFFAWALVFVFLALRIVLECIVRKENAIDFAAIFSSWLRAVPFLVLFLVHNYLVAPIMIYKKRPGEYVAFAILLLMVFVAWFFWMKDGPEPGMIPPEPPEWGGEPDFSFPDKMKARPMNPDALRVLVGITMVAANLGLKAFFHSEREKSEMQRLEKENLRFQLEYLRYQINPHFFMNTLNNIHALVDIDPEKAKESIVEFSKFMRHVLYDSDKATIPLSQELDLLEHYVSLMRLRYPEDKVKIEFDRPQSAEGAEVPPLAFASFVENAFKHGLSFRNESFIRFGVALEGGKIIFRCINSRFPGKAASSGGVGLDNARNRFRLLYADAYTLHIEEKPDVYDLLLVLPATPLRIV